LDKLVFEVNFVYNSY